MSKTESPKTPKLVIVKGRKIEITDKKLTTGKFRLSYPHLFQPKAFKGQEPKYSLSMLFNKDDDLSQLEVAAHNAAQEKWGADKAQWPSKKVKSKKTGKIISKCLVKMPFKDGETEHPDKPEYENVTFLNASSKKPPMVINQGKEPIADATGLKAGDYARASLIAFAYEGEGSFGVSFALIGVQKVKTGESLGGGNAINDFDEVEFDEDEEMDSEETSESDDEEETDY